MDIIKKNIVSIVLGAIALVALVAFFWPLGAIKAEGRSAIAQRVTTHNSMQTILRANRTMPVYTIESGEAQPLEVFPTQRVIAWGQEMSNKLREEAAQVRQVAAELNRRPLLVPGSLPRPTGQTEFTFIDSYITYLEGYPLRFRAGEPMSGVELQTAADELWRTKYLPNVIIRNNVQDPTSLRLQQEAYQRELAELPERMRAQRARGILFYLAPGAIVPSQAALQTPAGSSVSPAAIWDAQLRIWVKNDILGAIMDMNQRHSQTNSVVDAPVKHVLSLQIDNIRGAAAVPAAGGMPGGMGGPPGGIPFGPPGGIPFGPPPEVLARMGMPGMGMGATADTPEARWRDSVTGRRSNPLYDVVPFTMTVHVEADRFPLFIAELSKNRFLTITEVSSMRALDTVVYNHLYNVAYGTAPVVEATVRGEALLMRDWTVDLMPATVRQMVGIDTPAVQ